MDRLDLSTVDHLPADIARPAYAIRDLGIGIVHLGIGAFHRAHQAIYTDDALTHDGGRWGICGVSLRSAGVPDRMLPQDGLYTSISKSPDGVRRQLEAKEVKMSILALLSLPLSILGFTALAAVIPAGLAGPLNAGPHGFSEILYAFTSATGNNGSAFAGISANTWFYNTALALAMITGRFVFVVPVLAVAGSLASKKLLAPSAGTFPTTSPLFVGLLVGVILILGGLTYFPAVALGPGVEQVAMTHGTLFATSP